MASRSVLSAALAALLGPRLLDGRTACTAPGRRIVPRSRDARRRVLQPSNTVTEASGRAVRDGHAGCLPAVGGRGGHPACLVARPGLRGRHRSEGRTDPVHLCGAWRDRERLVAAIAAITHPAAGTAGVPRTLFGEWTRLCERDLPGRRPDGRRLDPGAPPRRAFPGHFAAGCVQFGARGRPTRPQADGCRRRLDVAPARVREDRPDTRGHRLAAHRCRPPRWRLQWSGDQSGVLRPAERKRPGHQHPGCVALVCRIGRGLAQGTEQRRIELGDTRIPSSKTVTPSGMAPPASPSAPRPTASAGRAPGTSPGARGRSLRCASIGGAPSRTRTPATGSRGLRRSPR